MVYGWERVVGTGGEVVVEFVLRCRLVVCEVCCGRSVVGCWRTIRGAGLVSHLASGSTVAPHVIRPHRSLLGPKHTSEHLDQQPPQLHRLHSTLSASIPLRRTLSTEQPRSESHCLVRHVRHDECRLLQRALCRPAAVHNVVTRY
jgi:hypothetical protein